MFSASLTENWSVPQNQLTFSNTLIRTQAAQHGKYLIEQRASMYNAQGNTLVTLAAQAKATGDGGAYANATAATMAWAKSILADEKLPLETYKTYSDVFTDDLYEEISLRTCVARRISAGGTGPASVQAQLDSVAAFLAAHQ